MGWKRVLSGIIFVPILIYIVQWAPPFYFLILVALLILLGQREFYALVEEKGVRPFKIIGIISGLLLGWLVYMGYALYLFPLLTLVLLLTLAGQVFRRDYSSSIANVSTTLFGILYVSWLFSHLIMIRTMAEGAKLVLLVFAITWANDIGAYLVGVNWGRHRLIPAISPHKSLEGAIGGLAFAVLGAFLSKWGFLPALSNLSCLILGLLLGAVGQIGDLGESSLKRDANIKDAGFLIPGHGGILDRFDSLLFTGAVFYYYLKLLQLEH